MKKKMLLTLLSLVVLLNVQIAETTDGEQGLCLVIYSFIYFIFYYSNIVSTSNKIS